MRDTSAGAGRLVMGMPHASGFDDSEADGAPGGVHSFEVQLVLEYCDRGSLRDALDRGAFRGLQGPHSASNASDTSGSGHGRVAAGAAAGAGPAAGGEPAGGPGSSSGPLPSGSGGGDVNYRAVLDTAVDIATAMVHLHGRNVLHADLKVAATPTPPTAHRVHAALRGCATQGPRIPEAQPKFPPAHRLAESPLPIAHPGAQHHAKEQRCRGPRRERQGCRLRAERQDGSHGDAPVQHLPGASRAAAVCTGWRAQRSAAG